MLRKLQNATEQVFLRVASLQARHSRHLCGDSGNGYLAFYRSVSETHGTCVS